jgi:hypothetical protein
VQFKVPQNIDMADRIVGPLTLIQFLYLLVGGIVIYFLFTTIAPVNSLLFLALAGPLGLFTFALAFLKIQDQPFPKFVVAFFVFLFRPKARVWFKEGLSPQLVITPETEMKKDTIERKTIKKSQLDQLVQTLDTGGMPATTTRQAAVAPPNHLKRVRPTLDNVKKK